MGVAVLGRGLTHLLREIAVEMAVVVMSGLEGDLGNRQLPLGQELARGLDAYRPDIDRRRGAENLFEAPLELARRHGGQSRQRLEAHCGSITRQDMLDHLGHFHIGLEGGIALLHIPREASRALNHAAMVQQGNLGRAEPVGAALGILAQLQLVDDWLAMLHHPAVVAAITFGQVPRPNVQIGFSDQLILILQPATLDKGSIGRHESSLAILGEEVGIWKVFKEFQGRRGRQALKEFAFHSRRFHIPRTQK